MRIIESLDELQGLIGQEVAVSDWTEITQQQVNLFAEATGDLPDGGQVQVKLAGQERGARCRAGAQTGSGRRQTPAGHRGCGELRLRHERLL